LSLTGVNFNVSSCEDTISLESYYHRNYRGNTLTFHTDELITDNSKKFKFTNKTRFDIQVTCGETNELYTGTCIGVNKHQKWLSEYDSYYSNLTDSTIITFFKGKIICVELLSYVISDDNSVDLHLNSLVDQAFNSGLRTHYYRNGKIKDSYISHTLTSSDGDTKRVTQIGSGNFRNKLEYIYHHTSIETAEGKIEYDSSWGYYNNVLESIQSNFHSQLGFHPIEIQIDIDGTQLANGDTIHYIKRVDGYFDGTVIIYRDFYIDDTAYYTSVRSHWDNGILIDLNAGKVPLVNSRYKPISKERYLEKFGKLQSKVKYGGRFEFDFESSLIESEETPGLFMLRLPKLTRKLRKKIRELNTVYREYNNDSD
jgi:hypothetical protein